MTMRSSVLELGLGELLDGDPRPAFIVDISNKPTSVVYTNPALSRHDSLRGIVNPLRQQNAKLWEWVDKIRSEPRGQPPLSFAHVLWTATIIQRTWLVIGANEQASSSHASPKDQGDIDEGVNSVSQPLTSSSAITDHRSAIADSPDSSGGTTPQPAHRTSSLQPPALMDRRTNSTPVQVLPSIAATMAPVEAPYSEPLRRATTDPGWIVPDIVAEQRPFLDVINSVDWAATPLGPMSDWPPRLHQIVNQILADSRAIAIYWGERYCTIYNEAFSKLCGSKHPFVLGRPVEETWPEGATTLKEAMIVSAEKQRASTEDEWRHFVEKGLDDGSEESRWLEEVYLKWSVVPLYDDDKCLGFMHPVVETTSMRLWERRMKMLIELGEVLVTPRDVKSYWGTIIDKLEAVEPRYDIPLAILYSVDDDPDAAADASRKYDSTKLCQLEGSLGVPQGHPIIPPTLTLRSSDDGLSQIFREALRAPPPHPLLLQTDDGSLPKSLIDGLQWRGFGDPCRAAVVLPIRPTKEENVMGLLFLGINPRRPYDNDYRQYISLLSQKITTSLASTVLLEEEARRGRNMAEQAAYDQAMLKEKLAAQTKEATESIQKFEAVAEFIPVGMCFGDNQGNITFANDAFCRITGLTREDLLPNEGYLPCVVEQDRATVKSAYEDLQSRQSITFEFRVKPHDLGDLPTPPIRNSPSFEIAGLDLVAINKQTERHVLASAKAERAPDGSIVRVLTCLTDVTLHKETAEEAVRRAQQAENLKRMAEFATVGMYDMDLNGRLLGANNVFFEMCGMTVVDPTVVEVKPWENCIYEDDYPMLREKFRLMIAEGKVQTVEVRFKNSWMAEDGAGHIIKAPRWVQATLMPVQDSEGVIKTFTGCLSDVSLQKWQLEREKERKEEAIESKRQQENFIDMTSHEMRNPLSAIIHCADAVTATLSKVKELVQVRSSTPSLTVNGDTQAEHDDGVDMYSEEQELMDSCIENAEIIVTCAQHQKRIVDDILTMSKLDSQLLAITPVTVNTIDVVQEALKMFEVEARRVDINLDMIVDQSYHDLGLTYLEFDPSRLKQVLINLLTNALKFTKTGPTRSVTVTMSASKTRPTDANSKVQFIPRAREPFAEDPSPRERRSDGPPIWLIFEVKDTGQGLTEEEMKSLFQRFVQASSRTHVKYGGSGLGLFISRRLTELQNGAIGVASSPGVGSTFAFYIEARIPSDDAVKEAVEAAAAAREFAAATMLVPLTRTNRLGATAADRLTPTSSSRNSPALSGLPRPPPSSSKIIQNTPSRRSADIEGVLIVEDNIINQHITRRGLNDYYLTDVANHGIEALEKVRNSDRYVETHDEPAPPPSSSSPPGSPLPSPILERTAAAAAMQSSSTSTNTGKATPAPPPQNSGRFPLSVILMDIEMPVQDGLTCTRHIREMERQGRIRGGRIPIIAVSANARAEQVREAREAGCDGVLVKPFRMHELIARMETVFGEVAGREREREKGGR